MKYHKLVKLGLVSAAFALILFGMAVDIGTAHAQTAPDPYPNVMIEKGTSRVIEYPYSCVGEPELVLGGATRVKLYKDSDPDTTTVWVIGKGEARELFSEFGMGCFGDSPNSLRENTLRTGCSNGCKVVEIECLPLGSCSQERLGMTATQLAEQEAATQAPANPNPAPQPMPVTVVTPVEPVPAPVLAPAPVVVAPAPAPVVVVPAPVVVTAPPANVQPTGSCTPVVLIRPMTVEAGAPVCVPANVTCAGDIAINGEAWYDSDPKSHLNVFFEAPALVDAPHDASCAPGDQRHKWCEAKKRYEGFTSCQSNDRYPAAA